MATLTTSSITFGDQTGLVVPLATVFTRPSSCESAVGIIPQATTAGPDSPCAPPEWHSVDWLEGYYSPGICPSGFSIGCSAWGSEWETQAPEGWFDAHRVKEGETAYICVPGGYGCTGYGQATTIIQDQTIYGPAIEIRWREVDLPLLETHPLSLREESASTAADPTLTETSDPPGPSEEISGGSSKGNKAAILGGTLGGIGGLALVGVIVWFCRRRRGRANANKIQEEEATTGGSDEIQEHEAVPPGSNRTGEETTIHTERILRTKSLPYIRNRL